MNQELEKQQAITKEFNKKYDLSYKDYNVEVK